jgi:hypothetical protein
MPKPWPLLLLALPLRGNGRARSGLSPLGETVGASAQLGCDHGFLSIGLVFSRNDNDFVSASPMIACIAEDRCHLQNVPRQSASAR